MSRLRGQAARRCRRDAGVRFDQLREQLAGCADLSGQRGAIETDAFTSDRIVQALAPSRPIDRGLAGPGLLAHVLVSKYADHMPLYRQSEILSQASQLSFGRT